MRKLFLSLTLVFAFSSMSFGSEKNTEDNTIQKTKTEILVNGDIIEYIIEIDEFDICTVTVTIVYPNGMTSSATASNNQGDCDAAYDLAYATAAIIKPA